MKPRISGPIIGVTTLPRKPNPDLTKSWKLNLPATLAGKIEYVLYDPIHNQPRYGARGFLMERLLEHWLAHVTGEPKPPLPSLDEVRSVRT